MVIVKFVLACIARYIYIYIYTQHDNENIIMKYCDVRMNVMPVYTTSTVMTLHTIQAHMFKWIDKDQFSKDIFLRNAEVSPFSSIGSMYLALQLKKKTYSLEVSSCWY